MRSRLWVDQADRHLPVLLARWFPLLCGSRRRVTCSRWVERRCLDSSIKQGKRGKHTATCQSHGFEFIPFGFSTFRSFGSRDEEVLSCICQPCRSRAEILEWEVHAWVFRYLSFALMRRVTKLIACWKLVEFSWWFFWVFIRLWLSLVGGPMRWPMRMF